MLLIQISLVVSEFLVVSTEASGSIEEFSRHAKLLLIGLAGNPSKPGPIDRYKIDTHCTFCYFSIVRI